MKVEICKHCGRNIWQYWGYTDCDHIHYPENCKVCSKKDKFPIIEQLGACWECKKKVKVVGYLPEYTDGTDRYTTICQCVNIKCPRFGILVERLLFNPNQ